MSQLLWFAWDQYNLATEDSSYQFWRGGLMGLVAIPFVLVYFGYRCVPFLIIFFAFRRRDTQETKVVYLIGAATLIVVQVWAIANLRDRRDWAGLSAEAYVIGLWILAVIFVVLGNLVRKTTYVAARTPPEE